MNANKQLSTLTSRFNPKRHCLNCGKVLDETKRLCSNCMMWSLA
jgi:predicted nucleic acid-binding Zn ribbon protein